MSIRKKRYESSVISLRDLPKEIIDKYKLETLSEVLIEEKVYSVDQIKKKYMKKVIT